MRSLPDSSEGRFSKRDQTESITAARETMAKFQQARRRSLALGWLLDVVWRRVPMVCSSVARYHQAPAVVLPFWGVTFSVIVKDVDTGAMNAQRIEKISGRLGLFLFTNDPMQCFEMPRKWFYPTPSCVVRVSILNIGENAKVESEEPSNGQGYRRRWGQYVT